MFRWLYVKVTRFLLKSEIAASPLRRAPEHSPPLRGLQNIAALADCADAEADRLDAAAEPVEVDIEEVPTRGLARPASGEQRLTVRDLPKAGQQNLDNSCLKVGQ